MSGFEQISYAKTVYGQEEIDAVAKCLSTSTKTGTRLFFTRQPTEVEKVKAGVITSLPSGKSKYSNTSGIYW